MSSDKMIISSFNAKIASFVNDKKKMKEFQTHEVKYMDRNHQTIFAQGPLNKLIFSKNDQGLLGELLNISDEDVKKVMKSVKSVQSSWKILNTPFLILSCFTIREMYIQKKDADAKLLLMYMSLKIYSGLFQKYFKYGVTETIMNFTLNDLSDKFKYKSLGNNYKVIEDIVVNSDALYRKDLIAGKDEDVLKKYLGQIFNRLNKVICNIARNYYSNRDSKKYLNTVSSYDKEDGRILDNETSDSLIHNLSENTTSFFISSSPNMKLIQNVAMKNSVPSGTIFQTISTIKKNEAPAEILNLLRNILMVIYESDNSIISRVCTREFTISAIRQLSVSNTKNKSLIDVKDKLDYLLNEYCSKYASTDRKATKMAYRNALYSYFVYLIIINKCG